MLGSDLCDYSDAYIVVKGKIIVRGANDANRINKKLTFKNNAPFRFWISKINNTFVDNLEDFWRSLDFPLINCEIELDLR